MTQEQWKFANELHYAVKGHLINPNYDEETVMSIYNSYLKRLWGNHERMVYSREPFEKLWDETYGKQSNSKSK